MHSIHKFAFRVLASKSSYIALTFLSQLVLARYLSPQDFGKFAVFFSTISLWQMLLSMRISLQVIRSSEDLSLNLYWNATLQEALIVSGLLGAIFLSLRQLSIDVFFLLIATFLHALWMY